MKKCLYLFALVFCCNFSLQALPAHPYYTWSNHPNQISILQATLAQANNYGLYSKAYSLSSILSLPKQTLKDSNRIDSLIHQVALHFYSDLKYGNRVPTLDHHGLHIKANKDFIQEQLIHSLQNNTLTTLADVLSHSSKEVMILLQTLQNEFANPTLNKKRVSILQEAINDYKWLEQIRSNESIILINIPSTQLHVYDGNQNPINMKVIVGKLSTPTNTLSSEIHQIIVNPYWNIPKSIATKEILPLLQKDKSYIETAHLQVLDLQYKLQHPNQINWSIYTEDNFPFYLRQSTGCDNSLGVIKLDFDSPFGIYLHDTPEKALFKNTQRFYSHGCMRMEKPIDMAKWIMRNDAISLDTIDFSKCYQNPAPIRIPVKSAVKIVVWYHLVDFDDHYNIKYYKDIYKRYAY